MTTHLRNWLLAVMPLVVLGVVLAMTWPPRPATLDRDGYWRNPSLVDVLMPPLEGAYRASIVKSIQTGTITIANASSANTSTITAVDTNTAVVDFLGATYDTDATVVTDNFSARVALTNATTVTATRGSTGNGLTVAYIVTEYYGNILRSLQRGTIALASVASNTATISAVTVAKTQLAYLGQSNVITGNNNGQGYITRLALTNTTTVTATKGNADANFAITVGYEAREFR